MKRIAWLTDIHLNFLVEKQIELFLYELLHVKADTYIVSGDIGESHSVYDYLHNIAEYLGKPVYFVLGNHDFYHGSLERVRAATRRLHASSEYLFWLTEMGVVELTPDYALVGHDSWADGRLGDYDKSVIMLNDYIIIRELSWITKEDRLQILHALGDEAAAYMRQTLPDALSRYRNVLVVTHVPPFKEACWHKGRISDDNFLPHFGCKAVGDVLLELVPQYPNCTVTVLCGHTHGEGEAQMLDNLRVLTGGSEYGAPIIQRVFEIV